MREQEEEEGREEGHTVKAHGAINDGGLFEEDKVSDGRGTSGGLTGQCWAQHSRGKQDGCAHG